MILSCPVQINLFKKNRPVAILNSTIDARFYSQVRFMAGEVAEI
jgi:hypothetical protein